MQRIPGTPWTAQGTTNVAPSTSSSPGRSAVGGNARGSGQRMRLSVEQIVCRVCGYASVVVVYNLSHWNGMAVFWLFVLRWPPSPTAVEWSQCSGCQCSRWRSEPWMGLSAALAQSPPLQRAGGGGGIMQIGASNYATQITQNYAIDKMQRRGKAKQSPNPRGREVSNGMAVVQYRAATQGLARGGPFEREEKTRNCRRYLCVWTGFGPTWVGGSTTVAGGQLKAVGGSQGTGAGEKKGRGGSPPKGPPVRANADGLGGHGPRPPAHASSALALGQWSTGSSCPLRDNRQKPPSPRRATVGTRQRTARAAVPGEGGGRGSRRRAARHRTGPTPYSTGQTC